MNERDKNVLIVDDDETVRQAYLRSLRGAWCNVEAVGDGEAAVRAMERRPYDVVMLDLRMPGEDGMAVLRTIKERWPEAEVVVITGYPSLETAKEAVRLGAHDYLAKPVGPDDVIRAASAAMLEKKWTLRRRGSGGARTAAAAKAVCSAI